MMKYFYYILCVIALLCMGARGEIEDPSKWPDFSPYDGRFRMGLEVEAGTKAMFKVMDYFNYLELLGNLPRGFLTLDEQELSQYIGKSENFNALPDQFRKRLMESAQESKISILEAWNNLPLRERNQQVDPGRLPKALLARYLGAIAGGLKLKDDAPLEVVEALKHLSIESHSPGARAITEFTHREDIRVLNPKEYLMDLRNISSLLGITQGLDQPGKIRGFSYHIHISDENHPISDPVLQLLNLRLMLQALKKGRTGILSEEGLVTYRSDLKRKGIIRRIAGNRVELRLHVTDPVSELKDILEILSLGEEQARLKLAREISVLLLSSKERKLNLSVLSNLKPEALVNVLQYVVPELGNGAERLKSKIVEKLKFSEKPDRVIESIEEVIETRQKSEVQSSLFDVLSHRNPGHPALRTSIVSTVLKWCGFGSLRQ